MTEYDINDNMYVCTDVNFDSIVLLVVAVSLCSCFEVLWLVNKNLEAVNYTSQSRIATTKYRWKGASDCLSVRTADEARQICLYNIHPFPKDSDQRCLRYV